MPSQIQNFSVCLGNASAKKTAEDLAETFVYHVSFAIPHHFDKDYDLVFYHLILLFYLYYIFYLQHT